jgi:uncharacterized CHY-type Zn-finger protein
MKVTKLGTPLKKEGGEVTCWSCRSELEYEWIDTRLHYNSATDSIRVVICPVCSNKIPINE